MEKKESNVFGLPFALVVFVVLLSILIDGFIWFFVYAPLRDQINQVIPQKHVKVVQVSPTPVITATPSATLTPTKAVFQRRVIVPSPSISQ